MIAPRPTCLGCTEPAEYVENQMNCSAAAVVDRYLSAGAQSGYHQVWNRLQWRVVEVRGRRAAMPPTIHQRRLCDCVLEFDEFTSIRVAFLS